MIEGLRSRRVGGMLCIAALHVGAGWWMASAMHNHTLVQSSALPPHEIIVRFFTALPKRADHVAEHPGHPNAYGLAMARPKKMVATRALPDETNRSDSMEAVPAPSPVAEATAPVIIDSEDVKRVIAGIVAEERGKDGTGAVLRAQGSAAQKALGQALRPRCENGDPASAGNVQLSGLMKLPSLMFGAVSDKGCRW